MSTADLRKAFNDVAAPTATCAQAFMSYSTHDGVQYQVLEFSGTYADGVPFSVKSDKVRPSGDLLAASRETAAAFLQQKRQTT